VARTDCLTSRAFLKAHFFSNDAAERAFAFTGHVQCAVEGVKAWVRRELDFERLRRAIADEEGSVSTGYEEDMSDIPPLEELEGVFGDLVRLVEDDDYNSEGETVYSS